MGWCNFLCQYITIEARGRAAHTGKQSLPSSDIAVGLITENISLIQYLQKKSDL